MRVSDIKSMLALRSQREQIYCTDAYWNAKAEEYEGDAVSMWPNRHLNPYYHREQVALFDRWLPDVRGKTILDIGCGTGRFSRHLAARGARVEGVDFAASAVEIARKQTEGDNPTYRVLSIFDLDDPPRFDLAVTGSSLVVACRTRAELRDALARIHAALRPNGQALILEPIHRGFLHRVLDMDVREFRAVMEEVGFTIQSFATLHYWPMRLLLAFLPWPRALTAAGYHLGQGLMALTGNTLGGDYTAILATRGGG